jgi:hypothetical protein
MLKTYKIITASGKISPWSPNKLDFLTLYEQLNLDNIGYCGKDFKGKKWTRTSYLNSLNKGEFHIEINKFDNGDFSEEFTIFRNFNEHDMDIIEKNRISNELINKYMKLINNMDTLNDSILERAIIKLNNDEDPYDVNNWVELMLKTSKK